MQMSSRMNGMSSIRPAADKFLQTGRFVPKKFTRRFTLTTRFPSSDGRPGTGGYFQPFATCGRQMARGVA
jgi:hypothetical protein